MLSLESFIKGNQLKQDRCECGLSIFSQTFVTDSVNTQRETGSMWPPALN